MSYERISLSLISACSALLGAAIGAWAVTWAEKRRHRQAYQAKILSLLEERLENLAHAFSYVFTTEKIEEEQVRKYHEQIIDFAKKHPLLLFQVKVIDRKLYGYFQDLAKFASKKLPPPGPDFQWAVQETANRLLKCLKRIYKVWTK